MGKGFSNSPMMVGRWAGLIQKGKQEGVWYNDDSALGMKLTKTFKSGVLHGPETAWMRDGKKYSETIYKDGIKQGTCHMYGGGGISNPVPRCD